MALSWQEELRQQMEAQQTYDNPWLQLEDNKPLVFRVLANVNWQIANTPDPNLSPYHTYNRHWINGIPLTCGEDQCRGCNEVLPKLMASRNKEDVEIAKRAAKQMTVAMCVSRVVERTFQPPKAFEFSVGGARSWGYRLLGALINTDMRMVEHPFTGRNIKLLKKVVGRKMSDTSYDFDIDTAPTKVPRDVWDARYDVSTLIRSYNERLMMKAFSGAEFTKDDWRELNGGDGEAEPEGYDTGGDDWGTQGQAEGGDNWDNQAPVDDQGYAEGEATGGDWDAGADASNTGEGDWDGQQDGYSEGEAQADGGDWGGEQATEPVADPNDQWADVAPAQEPVPVSPPQHLQRPATKQAAPPPRPATKQAAPPPQQAQRPATKQAAPPAPPARPATKQAGPPATKQAAAPPPRPATKQAAPPSQQQRPATKQAAPPRPATKQAPPRR